MVEGKFGLETGLFFWSLVFRPSDFRVLVFLTGRIVYPSGYISEKSDGVLTDFVGDGGGDSDSVGTWIIDCHGAGVYDTCRSGNNVLLTDDDLDLGADLVVDVVDVGDDFDGFNAFCLLGGSTLNKGESKSD